MLEPPCTYVVSAAFSIRLVAVVVAVVVVVVVVVVALTEAPCQMSASSGLRADVVSVEQLSS